MRLTRFGLAAAIAMPTVLTLSFAPSTQVAAAEPIVIDLPGMTSSFFRYPLFTGESGYVFYLDDANTVWRWNIDGSEDPLQLMWAPNGIDTVSADGSRLRVGSRMYVITGTEYERLSLPSGFFRCPDGERLIGSGYSPNDELAISVCFGGGVKVAAFGGSARTFQIGDIPENAANASGKVVLDDDGSFRVVFNEDATDTFGPGASISGKFLVEYDADGNTIGTRLPTQVSSQIAGFYSSRSSYMPNHLDPIGDGAYETADGVITPFLLAGDHRPPAAVGDARRAFTYLHSFSEVGFGSACMLANPRSEPRWCYEGDLIRGGGRWFQEDALNGFQVGTITGDGLWYSRRTAIDQMIIQKIEPQTPPPANRVCIDVAGAVGDFAVVNLTPVEAAGGGYVQLAAGDLEDPPIFSNANFDVGTIDPNVAVAPIGPDGDVCLINNISAAHLIADHLGTIAQASFTPAQPDGTPQRKIDTRGSPIIEPGGRVCIAVAGDAGDYAVVNVTPVEATGGGYVQVVSSDLASPPVFSNANFAAGSIDPNLAIAPIGSDGNVCLIVEISNAHVVADHLGTIDADVFTPAQPNGSPDRLTDTRGGPKVGVGQRVCLAVAGDAGDFAVLNLTPVEADGGGYVQLVSSDDADPPVFSNANFAVGTIDPNVAIAPIGSDGKVCAIPEISSTHLVIDHLGTLDAEAFDAAQSNGAPDRKMDTRLHGKVVDATP